MELYDWVIGVDEVGRGPLAGPVVASATLVIFTRPLDRSSLPGESLLALGVKDSKKVSEKKRQTILTHLGLALCEGVQSFELQEENIETAKVSTEQSSVLEIDELNILRASQLAMERAVHSLIKTIPRNLTRGLILVDGHLTPAGIEALPYTSESIIKGDQREVLIALASIMAKTFRDQLMKDLDKLYPGYGLAQHAGYPTKLHREALTSLGVSSCHRKSFRPVADVIDARRE